MRKIYLHWFLIIGIGILFFSCSRTIRVDKDLRAFPPIFPDYTEVTIPVNIAPLHFELPDSCHFSDSYAVFQVGSKSVKVNSEEGQIAISESDWSKLINQAKGSFIKVKVFAEKEGKWIAYAPFHLFIAQEPIDAYIAYRLIEPGYEKWNEMGLYQRCLENYNEKAIITNKLTNYNCMNCHSFCQQSPDKMLFHMRKDFGATYLIEGDKIEKLNTKTPQTLSALVYPSWHPTGNFVAFSVNSTKQMFHTTDKNRIEVFDYASDVVVYDVKKHEIVTSPLLSSKMAFETFPTFSADGKTLYYCSADSVKIPDDYNKVRYSLCSISFDPLSRAFGNKVDTLYNARIQRKSVSFPRVSPNGKFLMFTLSGYGNFSIWHKDADLYMVNLSTRTVMPMDILNSRDVESYHSWSSNSRWVVFSSRRIDGLYTRPFIAYIDKNGKASKPFLLPQDNVNFYERLLKSFNIPEFVKGPVKMSAFRIAREARKEKGIDVTFK